MRKRFSLGSKTVEVNFVKPKLEVAQSNLDCSLASKTSTSKSSCQEISCDCSWTGDIDSLDQEVHPRRVDLKCPSCSQTLAEVVYTSLASEGNDARVETDATLPNDLSKSELEDSGRTHLDESSSRTFLQ